MKERDFTTAKNLDPSGNQTVPPLPVESPSPSILASITPQTTPQAVARFLWQAVLTQCGDSYYYFGPEFPTVRGDASNWKIEEFKNVTFSLDADYVRPAEHLNGLEWHGVATMKFSLHRTFGPPVDHDGRLSEWDDGDEVRVYLGKRNGEWLFLAHEFVGFGGGEFNPYVNAHAKLSCAVVKSILK
jgi:hypothetical protein